MPTWRGELAIVSEGVMIHESRLPTFADWQARAGLLQLRRAGQEWRGPCPSCGGTDRFRVNRKGFFCRCCCPDGRAGADAMRRIVESAGFDWPQGRRNGATRPVTRRTAPNGPRPSPEPEKPAPGRDLRAVKLWEASEDPHDSPALQYLCVVRLIWPPDEPLPGSARWLPREALGSLTPPPNTAGCVAFAYRGRIGEVGMVKLEALTAAGRLTVPRWRRNVGKLSGLRFETPDHGGGSLHVCEGELSGLAVGVQCAALGEGLAVALGGSSGDASACWDSEGRSVVIHCDRDRAGRVAARKLRRALNRNVTIPDNVLPGCDGVDPADVLAGEVGERFAIQEFDGGLSREAALQSAWQATRARLAGRELVL